MTPRTWTINGQTFTEGDPVTAEVVWKDGRRTQSTGKLIAVIEGEAYIEASLGNVVADAETMELA